MKKGILLILILAINSCKEEQAKTTSLADESIADNIELIEIYQNDQADRQTDHIDWNAVSKRDSIKGKKGV